MDPLLNNDRDRREWFWICKCVGEPAAMAAISKIQGNRKPYVSNIAKVLGVEIPEEKYLPLLDDEKGQVHAKSKQILGDALKMLSGKS